MSRWKPWKRPVWSDQPRAYWNGEPVQAKRVTVIVADSVPDGWWCAGLENTTRKAVRVTTEVSTFYLDDEDGSGWRKVTVHAGSPRAPHRSLPVSHEVSS